MNEQPVTTAIVPPTIATSIAPPVYVDAPMMTAPQQMQYSAPQPMMMQEPTTFATQAPIMMAPQQMEYSAPQPIMQAPMTMTTQAPVMMAPQQMEYSVPQPM